MVDVDGGEVRLNTATAPTRVIRVLQSQPASSDMTRYGAQVTDHAPADVEHLDFTWRRALLGRYDVLHAHWPEYLVRHRLAPVRWARRVGFRLLVRRLGRGRLPVVRTLHNLAPHEAGDPGQARMLAAFDACTTCVVRLNPFTPTPPGVMVATIPHGHYIDRFEQHPVSTRVAGRLLHVGQLKPYKGIEDLLAAFADGADDASLRVVGRPFGQALRDHIETAAAADPRVTCELRTVSDAELVAEITAAEIVVLPYREMHNSGILFVALSLGRPVVVPANDVNRDLAAEIGPGWLGLYDGALSGQLLRALVAELRGASRPSRPPFRDRSWPAVAASHAAVYRRAVEGRPGHSMRPSS